LSQRDSRVANSPTRGHVNREYPSTAFCLLSLSTALTFGLGGPCRQFGGKSFEDDEDRCPTDRPEVPAPRELRGEPVGTETFEYGFVDALFGSGEAEGEIQLSGPFRRRDVAQVHVRFAERHHDPRWERGYDHEGNVP
jgi:hypothetical protein